MVEVWCIQLSYYHHIHDKKAITATFIYLADFGISVWTAADRLAVIIVVYGLYGFILATVSSLCRATISKVIKKVN